MQKRKGEIVQEARDIQSPVHSFYKNYSHGNSTGSLKNFIHLFLHWYFKFTPNEDPFV